MILKHKCIECGKPTDLKHEMKFPSFILKIYNCGHSTKENIPSAPTEIDVDLISTDGMTLRPYQLEGSRFLVKTGLRGLCIDEQGLGKTLQCIAAINAQHKLSCVSTKCSVCNGNGTVILNDLDPDGNNRNTDVKCIDCNGLGYTNPESPYPVLFIVKTKLKMQWMKEIQRWLKIPSQIIQNESSFVIPGIQAYIVSAHSLSDIQYTKKNGVKIEKGFKDIEAWILKTGIKTIVLDEAQIIKNHDAKVTNSIRKAVKEIPYFIGLSGTPIKNHAGEYFPLLNLVRPDKFPSVIGYERNWVATYWDGFKMKKGGLRDPEKFKEYTSSFIIRRTRDEVLPDLPTVNRTPRFSELGKAVEAAYQNELKRFTEYFDSDEDKGSAFTRQSNILAFLSRMRHLTGLSKIDGVVNFIEEFITETDRKYILFCHHKDVTSVIVDKLEALRLQWPSEWGQGILEIKSGMTDMEINTTTENFWSKNYRILIASTLAAGEGFNLQCCSDIGMMERQWNPANEEQAEARVCRFGQVANKITATYFTAVGTIDEFFAELVERKRSMMKSVLDNKEYVWDESSLINELSEVLASTGRKKWTY